MNYTPNSKTHLSRINKFKDDDMSPPRINIVASSTPNPRKSPVFSYDTYSPIFSQYSQDYHDEDVEVIWDWNSPQSKPKPLRKIKRLHVAESPKLSIKRQPLNNLIPTFDKIKEELTALQNIDEVTDNKNNNSGMPDLETGVNKKLNFNYEQIKNDSLNDYFNDSVDQDLILCSQKEEEKFENSMRRTMKEVNSSNSLLNNSCKNSNNAELDLCAEDSFSMALEAFKEEDFELLSQVGENASNSSTANCKPFSNTIKNSTEYGRNNNLDYYNHYQLKNDKSDLNHQEEFPIIKYSPEEIEQKRLNALAKLESKKKLEIIEKKKREAMKRLEMNRKKRILQKNK